MIVLSDFLIFICTNIFRIFVNVRFLSVFLEEKKNSRYIKYISMIICFFITSTGYLLYRNRTVNIITNISGIFLMALSFQDRFKKKILATAMIYFFNMICDVIVVITFSNYGMVPAVHEFFGTVTVFFITICEIAVEKIVYKRRRIDFIAPYWGMLLLIPLFSIVIIHCLIQTSFMERNMIIIESIGLLGINIIAFYFYSAMEEAYETKIEYELDTQAIEIYKNQLDIIINSQEQLRSFQHDIKYHMRELMSMAKEKEIGRIIAYLENMKYEVENPDETVYSGNKEIDGSLNYFLRAAQGKLKNVITKVTVPAQINIKPFDLNVILSNLLDNAIFAAEKTERKYIKIEITERKKLLYIHVENSYSGILKKDRENLKSTKPEAILHGYGLKNVKKVVKKISWNNRYNIFGKNILCRHYVIFNK